MRKFLSAVLIVVACVLVPAGCLSVWAKYEIGDTDRFVAATAPLAENDDVRGAVADAVTGGVMTQVDGGPLDASLRSFVHAAAESFTGSPPFKAAWDAAVRGAHGVVEDALASDQGRDISVDLGPVTEQVKSQLVDHGVALADRIPVNHTEITFVESKELGTVRKVFRAFQRAGPWPAVAAVVLAAGGIGLARRRRGTLMLTALGFALGGAALRVLVAVARGLTMDSLPSDVSRPAAGAGYDALTATLRTASWSLVIGGVALALITWLSGVAWHRFGGGRDTRTDKGSGSGSGTGGGSGTGAGRQDGRTVSERSSSRRPSARPLSGPGPREYEAG
ncbi:hypothetical protein [Streptomyces tsukubensis]|uniref:Integral membrane protein n=1 Tax=Streptomyces tsukubensis TaxID=83656 RepID=A0A1V4A540_9ACTN|nr:hypothetical protein [Streptomyces tsukubensis]OON75575.1 hypothetical protein B1H18_22120 [Streptomyces tsukubensis]